MLSRQTVRRPFDRYPLAREAAIAALLLGAFGLWIHLATSLATEVIRALGLSPLGAGSLVAIAVYGAVSGGITALALVAFAGAYVLVRDIDVRIGGFDATVLSYAGAGLLGGVALVALAWGVATGTGSSLSEITGTVVAPDTSVGLPLTITAIGLFIALPAYLLLTHVLIQRTIDRVARERVVVGVTALVVWLIGPTGLLSMDVGRTVLVSALLAVAIALPAVAAATFDRQWLVGVTALPLALLLVGATVQRIAEFGGVGEAGYGVALLGVVTLGVIAYQRTESMLPSALAYATFVVGVDVAIVLLEAGVAV